MAPKVSLLAFVSIWGIAETDFLCRKCPAIEPPTAYVWTLYFLAQHYDKQRKTDLALQTIDKAIEHTPTLVELYMTKGRILKVCI